MRGFFRVGLCALAVSVVVLASGSVLVACSAAPVIDPGKDKRDRQEMQDREDKATQELDRASKKAPSESVDDERRR